MWLRYWNLDRDPFDDRLGHFVETPTHVEAHARLVHAVESVTRSARLVAPGGLGKSTVLKHALDAIRSPTRRVARVYNPVDGADLFSTLARGLGKRLPADATRAVAWRALTEAVRLCRWQGFHVVMAIDGVESLESPDDRRDLDRLDHLDLEARITVLRVGRPSWEDEPEEDEWSLAIRLDPLTRSETSRYVEEKLQAAGRVEATLCPKSMTCLHSLSRGIPRAINRLARLALMAGSIREVEVVTPDLVDGVSQEHLVCTDPLGLEN